MFRLLKKKTQEQKAQEWKERRKKWLIENGWSEEMADRIVNAGG